jgi:DNA polymerase III subunit beta
VKLSCTKENLHQGLAITSHISTKNVNLPILNNVLLKADGGGLKLISTNLEIAITCSIRGKVEQQGEYTVPSKLFFDYVNLCPDERVDIDLVDNALSVSCGSSKTKINGIVSTEFPLVPPASDGQSYTVSAANFSRALSQTLFSAATNESRPELSGVFLSFNNPVSGKGSLTLAATDSYRLSEAVIKLSEASDDQKDVIVPQRTLSELNRVFSVFKDDVEAPELVAVVVTDNQVVFRYGGVEITSRTLEGPYPDYKQIIPEKTQTQVIIEKQDLQKAIKTASLFSKTGLFDIYLKTNVGEQSLVTSANDVSRGENSVTLASMIDGADNEIALNFRYLLDGVNAIRAEKVVCSMIDKASPCVITPFESPEEKYQYIVMPIRQ